MSESRWSQGMSAAEPFGDTLRAVSGMVDTVVLRTSFRLDRPLVQRRAACPVTNGGDASGEHPTQALIDLFAIEKLAGPITDLHVGISGNLTMRTCRSCSASSVAALRADSR